MYILTNKILRPSVKCTYKYKHHDWQHSGNGCDLISGGVDDCWSGYICSRYCEGPGNAFEYTGVSNGIYPPVVGLRGQTDWVVNVVGLVADKLKRRCRNIDNSQISVSYVHRSKDDLFKRLRFYIGNDHI